MRFVSWFCRITVAKIRLNERSSQSWFNGVIFVACSGLGKNRTPAFHAICVHYTMLFIIACSVMLFLVFLLSFSLSVFPYVIPLFLPSILMLFCVPYSHSLSLMLFFVLIILSIFLFLSFILFFVSPFSFFVLLLRSMHKTVVDSRP